MKQNEILKQITPMKEEQNNLIYLLFILHIILCGTLGCIHGTQMSQAIGVVKDI